MILQESKHVTLMQLYLLTHSMVQSPSWAANRFAASQEIPHISRNPKVHYRTHKRPPPGPAQSSPYTQILQIHPNIIHPSTPRSPQWYLSFRLPHQEPIHPRLLTHTRHVFKLRLITCEKILLNGDVPWRNGNVTCSVNHEKPWRWGRSHSLKLGTNFTSWTRLPAWETFID